MVRAIVGGRSQNLAGYTLNRAYQSFRQPGSSIKPLIVYTPALERGYSAESIVEDKRIEDGPGNADNYYAGEMTLRRAVEVSKNTVAWQIFEELTPQEGLSYLRKMNFSRIVDADEVPAASIGGLTNGVSPLEMAKGYATIENDGIYREPTCILRITDAQNNLIYRSTQPQTIVYQEEAARQMTDILTGVLTKEYATGYGWGLDNIGMPAAAKTGTTNDSKDGWFVGYTRYFTTSVWVGYDQPRPMPGLKHSNYPGSIWQKYMLWLHEGLDPKPFPAVDGEESVIDEESGEEGIGDEYITVDGQMIRVRDVMDGTPDAELESEEEPDDAAPEEQPDGSENDASQANGQEPEAQEEGGPRESDPSVPPNDGAEAVNGDTVTPGNTGNGDGALRQNVIQPGDAGTDRQQSQ